MFTNRSISRIGFVLFNFVLMLTLLIGTIAFPASVRATNTYTLTDLGTLGGSYTYAAAINEAGQVIGYSATVGDGADHGFVWANGVMTDLGTLGGNYSNPLAINEAGQVIGHSHTTGDAAQNGFVWVNGVMTNLTLGGSSSQVISQSEAGQVIGNSYTTGDASYHAFVWQAGVMTDLGTLGGSSSQVSSQNEAGQVIGISSITGDIGYHPFVWENGVMTDLSLGGTYSQIISQNEAGQVIGNSYTTGDASYHAFVWQAGVMTDLGTLGGTYSQVTAQNEAGQVIGYSSTVNELHSFVWDNGVMTDLGTFGGVSTFPVAINEAGLIIGHSSFADGNTHAFVWESGVMTDLGTLGGSYSIPIAFNESGLVIGQSWTTGDASFDLFVWEDGVMTDLGATTNTVFQFFGESGQAIGYFSPMGGNSHAFVWENGAMTDLGTLGGSYSQAQFFNEAGQIVGYSTTAGNVGQHVVVWENGVMIDLGTMGGSYSGVNAINEAGQIIGYATTAGNAEEHAFVAIASPTITDQTITVNTHAPASALNGSSFTVAATASSGLPVSYSSSGSCTNVGADFTMTSDTGDCTVYYDQGGDSNYNPAPQVTEVVTALPVPTTRYVAATGSNTSNDCFNSASPCATITYAISQAVSGNTISIAAGTYTEAGIIVNKDLTLKGAGALSTIVQAAASPGTALGAVFSIDRVTVTIQGITIQNGNTTGDGGGIFNNAGTLMLNYSAVSGNLARNGGGLFTTNNGTMTLNNSTVSGNSAANAGGGIFHKGGTLTLNNSTISGNTARAQGGGLFNTDTVTLNYSTVTNNTSDSDNDRVGDGGGIYNGRIVNLKSSIVAGNKNGTSGVSDRTADCSGTMTSLGYNLTGSGTGCNLRDKGDVTVTTADVFTHVIGVLASNGGTTQTHALIVSLTNPALNAIRKGTNDCTVAPFNLDQRGEVRPFNTNCDIGAYEAQSVPPAENPVPSLDDLSPASARADDPDLVLDINGADFATDAVVRWHNNTTNTTTDLSTTYISSSELTAVLPSALLANTGTFEVSVFNPAPGGGTSTALPFFVTQSAASIISSDTATSTSPTETAVASTGGSGVGTPGSITASATGTGTVTVAIYDSNPRSASPFRTSGNYFDVYIAQGSNFSSATIVACNMPSFSRVRWLDGNTWRLVNPQSYSNGCVTMNLSNTSRPTIAQLTGTIFGVEETPFNEVLLLDSEGNGLAGATVQYYASGWQNLPGSTDADGILSYDGLGLSGNVTFRISYANASIQKQQNITNDPEVIFQTQLVSMQLLASDGSTELNGDAQYYSNGWRTFGGGSTSASMELLPLNYTFRVSYGGASIQKQQNIANDPAVIFQTKLASMQLLASDGTTELTGTGQYYANGWKTFGSGSTSATMELLPVNYTFRVSYGGASIQKQQDVNADADVLFQTKLASMQLLASDGTTELPGTGEYYANGWKTFGNGSTSATMELLPVNYTFRVSYGGASIQKQQDVNSDAAVLFQTKLASMQLLASDGTTELPGTGEYYANGWKTFGSGSTSATMELLPVNYTFRVSYGGASIQKQQNVSSDPAVLFQTKLVTMKLLASDGTTQLPGTGQYYANGWKNFSTGSTTTSMELLPVSYTFRVSYGGASVQKVQDVNTNTLVVFQTGQVHSNSASATQYYANGWKAFTQDMELLPGSYAFKFNDGTPQTTYPLSAGIVNSIH